MKTIEVDEEIYGYIASQTRHIGESASDILRRLLKINEGQIAESDTFVSPIRHQFTDVNQPKGIVVSQDAGNDEGKVSGVKVMRELLISDEFAAQKKVIDRFIIVLSTLYSIDSESFSEATQVKGRKRIYFSDNEQTLLENGKTTKPRAIPNTPFWVITNNNTSRKQQMIEQVMARMHFPIEIIEKVTLSI